ncbi:MAG: fructose-bisphosphate aldolase, partial [Nanoarchaeota archaeon]
MVNLSKITKKGKALFLAYDQGLEHGPIEFNDENVNPASIIDIAKKGKFTAIIFQKGIAEKYNSEIKNSGVPLIIKLNGKTNLLKGEPMSEQLCTVDEAISLGASAVGYTIFIGSEYESKMLKEFEKIESESHKKRIPVIAWIYPRGKSIEGRSSTELMAYSARVGLEIGADIVKLQYNGNVADLKWAVKSAGKCKIVLSGGAKTSEKEVLQEAEDAISAGASGLAIGRNVWQAKNPIDISKKIRKII